jgi:hypothetical protein
MAEAEKDPQEAVIAALKTFVEDIEVVGIAETRSTWPDLLVTYNAAVLALKGVGRYESDLEPDAVELDGDLFEEQALDGEVLPPLRS